MRSLLLLLAVDVLIVVGGILLLAPHPEPAPARRAEPAAADTGRLEEEARALRAEAERLRAALPSGRAVASGTSAAAGPGAAPGRSFDDADLDRLEAALGAVEERRVRERQREGLLTAVRHVYPGLTGDQQRDVAEAIGAYREIFERALRPGGAGALDGWEAGVTELRARLRGVVPPEQAEEIVTRYAIRPGPPAQPPAVSPPVRRK